MWESPEVVTFAERDLAASASVSPIFSDVPCDDDDDDDDDDWDHRH